MTGLLNRRGDSDIGRGNAMKILDRESATHEPKGEASEEPSPADTLISNFNSRIVRKYTYFFKP